ncbi:MAG: ATP-dependent helicase, partial [Chitinophagaceae bacterium]|nr:ATP-dependent helicase [Chitinophagaceae bacterium]
RNSTLLSSATQAVELPEFLNLNELQTLNFLDETQKAAYQLEIHKVLSPENDKLKTLEKLLGEVAHKPCIVFCNHRDAVERVNTAMNEAGLQSVFYHGGMEQHPREVALCKFRNGTSRILITTDLAARGLDIAHVRSIIHYHLPATAEVYTHRNGRTARMEAIGDVMLILGPDETLPEFIPSDLPEFKLPEKAQVPEKPIWGTLFFSAGKKDKISKMDIVGFLIQKGGLRKEDIGLIEVFDYSAFAAVRRSGMNAVLAKVKDQRIKNKKLTIAPAR